VKKILIIVESPTKMKTLRKFLDKNYSFESSIGHVIDLPSKKFGIDVENKFAPEYEILSGKEEVVKKLKSAAKDVDLVYLSPDPDREGEAIAWHIASVLPKNTKYKRVTFNEFTKDAVNEALKTPREIDLHLVNAQQARRLLDRMVGYKISPLLHKKIPRKGQTGSLSAGRVQSVALKLVVDRERAIDAFTPVEYWNLGSNLKQKKGATLKFEANLYAVDGIKVEKEKIAGKKAYLISNEKKALEIQNLLEKATYKIETVSKKEKKRSPSPPFITSTLQQEAARHYGFSATKTMQIAQSLYEGVDLGKEGTEGLITYMRTDSVRASPEAITHAREHISEKYGKKSLPEKPNIFSTKKTAQDAHEAIRPTNLQRSPDLISSYLTSDQKKLYLLIWQRFIASQMTNAIYDTISSDIITDNNLVLRATGSLLKFPGFLAVYKEMQDTEEETNEDSEKSLPDLKEGEALDLINTFANQSFTKAPPRFTEASLIKELEKSGIGRPSTYTSIMQKIVSRAYTVKEKGSLKPTELGKIICQMLEENFPKIMDIQFTAQMENDLDKIAETDVDWKAFLKQFWDDFYPAVTLAEKEAKVPRIKTDLVCPDCGSPVEKVWAGDKYFLGCSKYPDCKYTAPIEDTSFNKADFSDDFNWEQPCPICSGEMKVRKSRFGHFLGCAKYPECKGIVNIPKKGEAHDEDLPKCPAIGCLGQITKRRSRFGKTFYSCSSFPDCNVIVNDLSELSEKYKNYEKTPYEKPAKGARKGRNSLLKPSKELSAVIGEEAVSRGDATKKIWGYIKEKNLQDPSNKRKIVPDKLLTKVIGKDSIDMMKLAGFLSKHLS
jgi:DNA topoisomerase-1